MEQHRSREPYIGEGPGRAAQLGRLRLMLVQNSQVHNGENEVDGDYEDVPDQRGAPVGVDENVEDPVGPAEVGMIMSAATLTQAAAESTLAGRGLEALIPNTSALEAIIRPPADKPMKKANVKMYIPRTRHRACPWRKGPFLVRRSTPPARRRPRQ